MHRDESYPLQRNRDPQDNWVDSHDATSHEGMDNNKSDIAALETRTPSQNSCDERSHMSSFPFFKSAPQTHIPPHLPKLTLQEEASICGIEAKTFAELGGSNSSRLSHSPRTYQPVRLLQEEEPASALSIFESENGSPELGQVCSAGPRPCVSSPQDINSTPQVDYPCSSSAQPTAKGSRYGQRRHHSPSKTSHTDPNDVRWVCVCVVRFL